MSLEVIYVVRHGFRSSWSVDHLTGTYTPHIRSPTGLPTDPALTSHGVEQASELASHLSGLCPPIDEVYSSPYYRCLQTISPFISQRTAASSKVSSPCPCPSIRVEPGLSEWYGRARFEHPTFAPLDHLRTFFAGIDPKYVSLPAPRRRGESIPELYERVASCIQTIIAQCDREGKQAVLISTHAAVVIALGRILTGAVPEDPSVEDFRAFTCGLSMYQRQGSNPECLVNDMPNTARSEVPRKASTQHGMQATNTPHPLSRPALDSHGIGRSGRTQEPGFALSSNWSCAVNSDCSFLQGGEERGWKFSGDESFIEAGVGGFQLLPLTSDDGNAHSKL
ncbi:phosphoglycerate mutase-like protein [Astrocystis sublimbata]|nr:phosphoglycerate mutase-like protein [Astrocystis sublimbata]